MKSTLATIVPRSWKERVMSMGTPSDLDGISGFDLLHPPCICTRTQVEPAAVRATPHPG
ncbi:hypothetical protein AB3662_38755 [Sorangium cellulosum]|uniref:hypothetical protein n=1 Tax=Sorangium cellulosum TaxID=56 RepID=UPI003D9AA732